MTGAVAILSELQRRGVSVTADGDALVLKPRRAVDSELLARVREHKPEIIRALSARPATCAPSCYEIGPGRWIHHPWDGCKTPMPESVEPIVPARADCGCPGTVCSRCWLCAEVHCRCLPKTACWHCGGGGRCGCVACWKSSAGETAECVVCHGSGKIVERIV
jgi:hypothetical protein